MPAAFEMLMLARPAADAGLPRLFARAALPADIGEALFLAVVVFLPRVSVLLRLAGNLSTDLAAAVFFIFKKELSLFFQAAKRLFEKVV